MFPKSIVSVDVKLVEVNHDIKQDEVGDDVKSDKANDDVKSGVRLVVVEIDKVFIVREYMLQWVCREARKLGFGVVIGRFNNDSDRRQAFVTMICERSGMYHPRIRKLKQDDTGLRKYECPSKLRRYHMADEIWKFNIIFCIHNHALTDNLAGYPIVCRLALEERELVSDMTLNKVAPKNILVSLKQRRPLNISNIKKIYNVRDRDSKAVRGPRSKMQYLLKLLENDNYVFRYRDNVTWALKIWKTVLKDQQNMPQIIITDHDTALMNSVEIMFHTSSALLCKYHITKNVRIRVKPAVKEKIVCAWTDQVRHFGNTTTNRVESTHARLKNSYGNSKGPGPFEKWMCFPEMGYLIENAYDRVYLKLGCHIPKTSLEWTAHFTQDVETWLYHFLERMEEFAK
ncbi:uncharacterized protein LOC131597443 [Vicia villosa]|uniref:uncharacterized protein LOC131597443 n=1 Tax=Vicia villosa TaxID=3911 RepID=UPI00273C1200|nr:uncharacterized protein LOC131597443 [Vicia villosa]